MRRLAPLLAALALGAPAGAQVSTFPYAARVYQVTGLPTCTAALSGRSYGVYDGADAEDCDEVSGGGGTHDHSCICNGSSWVAIARRDEVPDGSGTANQIAYWSDTDTLTSASSAVIESGAGANTLVVDSGSQVGIGTASPSGKLEVEGTSGVISYFNSSDDGAVQLRFQTDSENRRIIAGNQANTVKTQLLLEDDSVEFWGVSEPTAITVAIPGTGSQLGVETATPATGASLDLAGSAAVLRLNPHDAPPTCASGLKGALYYDASLSELCDCDGSSWAQVDGGGAC